MQDIQLRRFQRDFLLVLRYFEAKEGKPTEVKIVIILPKTDETKTISVTLAPNKNVDHLREELRGELREKEPKSFQDVEDLLDQVRTKTPRLFMA